jgi:hypothetical protein
MKMTYTFSADNTEGYTAQELAELNSMFEAKANDYGFEAGSDEYIALFQAFSDEVSHQ